MIRLVNAHDDAIAGMRRDADQLHAADPQNRERFQRAFRLFVLRSRFDCVGGATLCQCQNSSPSPSDEGVTNRGGGKRWTGPRPLAVPPSRPTSRPVGHFGRRKSVSRFPSQQPHQHRDTQRNPGGDQKPFDHSAKVYWRHVVLHGGDKTP